MAEYLARVSWQSIMEYKTPKHSNDAPSQTRLALTDQYGSGQPILAKLRFGDGLWLFTAPEFSIGKQRRILPPSVLGRISITHQRCSACGVIRPADGATELEQSAVRVETNSIASKFKYWVAGTASAALPIHNAYAVLKHLTFAGTHSNAIVSCVRCQQAAVPATGPYGHLMQHFQSIRRLTDESVMQLKQLQDMVACRRTVFLGHRHAEASALVSEVATILQQNGALCWWDVQVMPQSRWYDDEILVPMLKDGIRQAALFVAFITPGYFEPGWAREELRIALEGGGPTIVPVFPGGATRREENTQQLRHLQSPIVEESCPRSIAELILQRLPKLKQD